MKFELTIDEANLVLQSLSRLQVTVSEAHIPQNLIKKLQEQANSQALVPEVCEK